MAVPSVPPPQLMHTTQGGTQILVQPGSKRQSSFDFIVRYQEPGKRVRTPSHMHFIIDLYRKREHDRPLTETLVDHILDTIRMVQPATGFPPQLQVFRPADVAQFQALNQFGEYPVEFLLVAGELVLIQEKTNYPNGHMSADLYGAFRRGDDTFSVVSTATFRGR